MDGTIEGVICEICDLKPTYFTGKDGEQKMKEGKRLFITRGKETICFEMNKWNRFADDTRLVEGFNVGDKVRVQYSIEGSKPFADKNGNMSNFTRLKPLFVELLSDELFEEAAFDKPKKEKKAKREVNIPAYSPHLHPLGGFMDSPQAPAFPVPDKKPLFDNDGQWAGDDTDLPF